VRGAIAEVRKEQPNWADPWAADWAVNNEALLTSPPELCESETVQAEIERIQQMRAETPPASSVTIEEVN